MLVLGNDYKHPAVVAKEAATLDVLSDGRLEFGLGAGWMTADYEALGMPYDSPGVRIERLAEALAVVKGAWGDGPFDFAGEHYTITAYDGAAEAAASSRARRSSSAVVGAKVLRLAGREADIVGINPILRAGEIGADAARDTLGDSTRRKVEWVREGAGERFDDLELQIRYFVAAITDDARRPRRGDGARVRRLARRGARRRARCWRARSTRCATRSSRRREEWGVSYVVFGDDQYEQFAPVVARLAGT